MAIIEAKCECGTCAGIVGIDDADLQRYVNGELVQDVWPNWTPDDREILIGWRTGIYRCRNCWEALADWEDTF